MTGHRSRAGKGSYWLGDPASQDREVVGDAVACLGRLADLEQVPPAFCLTAPPFGVLADGSLAEGATSVARMYARLASMTGRSDPPVVVRSALVGSRQPASWVAAPWTFWNVAGLEALRTSVTECAAPYVSDRARAYRAARPGQPADAVLAILVQPFIAAEVCSHVRVAFGGEHVTIRSRWGLCEFVEEGGWDTMTLRRADLSVIQRTIADKREMAVAGQGGVVRVDVPASNRLVGSLSDDQARRLAGFAARIAPQVGRPAEAEVAWRAGQMHLLWCEPDQA
jgi:phosphoenolpyruvate synthase/pyruvate phosphate dikinase